MTKLQTIVLAIVAGVVAGLLYKFVPAAQEVAAGFAGLCLLLLGWAKQHPADKPQAPTQTPTNISGGPLGFAAVVFLELAALSTPVRADEAAATTTETATSASSAGQVVQSSTKGNWQQALSIGATATMVNMQTGEVSAGAPLGACYGVTYLPFALGGDVCLYGELATKDHANRYIPSLLAHFQDVLGLGFGLLKEQGVSGVAPLVFLTGRIPVLKL